jgi:hypothetical protein
MKKTVYEAPRTERFQVELEGAFMSGSIVKGQSSGVETTGHELNQIDLAGENFTSDWNSESVDGWK